MMNFNLYSFHLLLQITSITIIFFITKKSLSLSLSPPPKLVVLPLKLQATPKGSIPIPTNKLAFRHNVTLTVSLTVGSPPQSVTMVLDTGSELSWLHCGETPPLHSVYNPLSSPSYAPIPCSSATCRTRTQDLPIPVSCDPKSLCHVTLSYADATSLEGTLAAETFRIGSSTRTGTLFGCMGSGGFSSNAEEDAKSTGLMGMNRGALSFVTQMGFPKFAYCISGRDSTGVLLFGEYPAARLDWLGSLRYTPLVPSPSARLPYFDRAAYSVQLEGIKVGGSLLPLPKTVFAPDHTGAGQTMVDSGTQFTFLLGPVYAALRSEFALQTERRGLARALGDPDFVFQGAMDLCYRLPPNRTSFADFPAVSLVFRGAEMEVAAETLLYRVAGMVASGGDWVYCFTFGNSDMLGIEAFVIGHHHQRNLWMEFDIANSRVGFVQVSCDLATHKLGFL